jgi:hypothetical protein
VSDARVFSSSPLLCWDIGVLSGHTSHVVIVIQLPDGSEYTSIRIWNTATGACESVLAGQTD